jgi:hypothetical protein
MNQKIRELAEQAGFQSIVRGDHIVFDISTKENLKEFAELIVRECAKLAKDESLSIVKKAELYAEPDVIDTAKATAWQFLVLEAKMKKHFGVEE